MPGICTQDIVEAEHRGRQGHPRNHQTAEHDLRHARSTARTSTGWRPSSTTSSTSPRRRPTSSASTRWRRRWTRRCADQGVGAACEPLAAGLEHLRDFKDLDKYWIEIHRLENEGDRISRDAVASLVHDGDRPDGRDPLEGHLRGARGGDRRDRERRPDPRGHRHQELVSSELMAASSSFVIAPRSPSTSPTASTTPPTSSRPRSRPGRRGRRWRSRCLAAQLRRRLHLDLGGGDGRQRRRRRSRDHADDRLRRADRGDRLEPRHLVLRAALELLARADRRRGRLRGRGGRASRRSSPTACSARSWSRRWSRRCSPSSSPALSIGLAYRIVGTQRPGIVSRGFKLRPGRLRRAAGPGPRHQRRAEDDGRDHPGADRQRQPRRRRRPADLGDRLLGGRRSRSAPTAAAGGSSRRPARGSSRWTPPRASARRARARR